MPFTSCERTMYLYVSLFAKCPGHACVQQSVRCILHWNKTWGLVFNCFISSHTMHAHNRIIKQTLRSCGSNATKTHMERVSLCAMFLLEACRLCDSMFGVSRSTYHAVANATEDINKLVTHLIQCCMIKEQPNREEIICFEDPVYRGMKKVSDGWLAKFLSSSFNEESDVVSCATDEDFELDVDYELYDYI